MGIRSSVDYSSVAAPSGDRGVFNGGGVIGVAGSINYIEISVLSNSFSFGSIATGSSIPNGCSNGSNGLGLFLGTGAANNIESFRILTLGNSTTYGTLTSNRYNGASFSNGVNGRGIMAGGYTTTTVTTIDYISMPVSQNAISFGSLSTQRYSLFGASNGINGRGVACGGWNAAGVVRLATCEYVTIPFPGNATNFGNLTQIVRHNKGTSNLINNRIISCGGDPNNTVTNNIDYQTISSPSTASVFGNLSYSRLYPTSTSNGTNNRSVCLGGSNFDGSVIYSDIDYNTISTLGNSIAFGNLSITSVVGATSNA